MKDEFAAFVFHVERVAKQYKSEKQMKDQLPAKNALIQMDSSENYNCQTMEEIQSAYWNASKYLSILLSFISKMLTTSKSYKFGVCIGSIAAQCHNGARDCEEISKYGK